MPDDQREPVPDGVWDVDAATVRSLAREGVEVGLNAPCAPDQLNGLDDAERHLLAAIMWHQIGGPAHAHCFMVVTLIDGARAFATIDVLAERFAGLRRLADPVETRARLLEFAGPSLLE